MNRNNSNANERDILTDNVDIVKLFNKYISLVKEVYGQKEAEKTKQRILSGEDVELCNGQEVSNEFEYRVLIDKRDGIVETVGAEAAKEFLKRPHIIDAGERISDIFIYPDKNRDMPHRLRCKVDGIQQTSIQLTPPQERYWQDACSYDMKELAKIRLAADCFCQMICFNTLEQSQDRSFKR